MLARPQPLLELGRRFPGFFIVGAPKCGTTSLFRWLQSHPATFLPVKELNFFSQDVYDTSHSPTALRTVEQYLDLSCPPEANSKLTGEATPKYLYSDRALEALAEYRDQVRLILMLRNPIDLVTSLHWQLVKQGDEPELDFEIAWHRSFEETRGGIVPGRRNGRIDRRFDYPFWGLLGQRLARVFELFDRRRVKVLILEEDMTHDPRRAFADVSSFLDLAHFDPPGLTVENASHTYRSVRLQQLVVRTNRVLRKAAYRVVDTKLPKTGLLGAIQKVNRRSEAPQPLPSDLRAELQAFFREDVQLTMALLGRRDCLWPGFL